MGSILVVMIALLGVVSGAHAPMLLKKRTVCLSSAHLGHLGGTCIDGIHCPLGVGPLCLVLARRLVIELDTALNVLRTKRRSLVLFRVEFSMRSYCLYHFTGQICER